MDEFVNEFNFGVNIFLQQIIKNQKTAQKRYAKRNSHVIQAMLKIKINHPDGKTNGESSK
jgi:hypothetical protein